LLVIGREEVRTVDHCPPRCMTGIEAATGFQSRACAGDDHVEA